MTTTDTGAFSYSMSGSELSFRKTTVSAIGVLHQLRMRPAFDQGALLDHADAIALPHGAEPVRDDERRAPDQQLRQRFLDQSLTFAVERARRLIQNEDR